MTGLSQGLQCGWTVSNKMKTCALGGGVCLSSSLLPLSSQVLLPTRAACHRDCASATCRFSVTLSERLVVECVQNTRTCRPAASLQVVAAASARSFPTESCTAVPSTEAVAAVVVTAVVSGRPSADSRLDEVPADSGRGQGDSICCEEERGCVRARVTS